MADISAIRGSLPGRRPGVRMARSAVANTASGESSVRIGKVMAAPWFVVLPARYALPDFKKITYFTPYHSLS
ncbi:hypothetical protein D3C87_2067410 [compost metagenome]